MMIKKRSAPPNPRGEFLSVRAAMIRYHRDVDGLEWPEIAEILSCDPVQVALIYETDREKNDCHCPQGAADRRLYAKQAKEKKTKP